MGIVILGCGNLLTYDEGVGIHVIRVLKETPLPEKVELIELRRPGTPIATIITNCSKLIIIDALKENVKGPGTVHRINVSQESMKKNLESTIHGFNLISPLKKMFNDSFDKKKPELLLLAVEIKERSTFKIGLSNEVKSGLDMIIDFIWHEISSIES